MDGILVSVSEQPDSLRAADVDREFVAERLRKALDEGRLDLSEYDDRLKEAYAARTYGDLKALLADLPEVAPPGRSQVVPAGMTSPVPAGGPVQVPSGHTRRWIAKQWSSWLTVAVILTTIWLLSGAHGDFWPAWPLGIWGAVMLASTIGGLASGEPRRQLDRDARRRAEREERRREERDERDRGRGQQPDDWDK